MLLLPDTWFVLVRVPIGWPLLSQGLHLLMVLSLLGFSFDGWLGEVSNGIIHLLNSMRGGIERREEDYLTISHLCGLTEGSLRNESWVNRCVSCTLFYCCLVKLAVDLETKQVSTFDLTFIQGAFYIFVILFLGFFNRMNRFFVTHRWKLGMWELLGFFI